MSNRKPHNHLAGYIFERKHSMGHIVCFDAEKAGIDAENKYVVVIECMTRDSIIGPCFTNLPKARDFVKDDLIGTSGYIWTS